jgi:hypothetical protein
MQKLDGMRSILTDFYSELKWAYTGAWIRNEPAGHFHNLVKIFCPPHHVPSKG